MRGNSSGPVAMDNKIPANGSAHGQRIAAPSSGGAASAASGTNSTSPSSAATNHLFIEVLRNGGRLYQPRVAAAIRGGSARSLIQELGCSKQGAKRQTGGRERIRCPLLAIHNGEHQHDLATSVLHGFDRL